MGWWGVGRMLRAPKVCLREGPRCIHKSGDLRWPGRGEAAADTAFMTSTLTYGPSALQRITVSPLLAPDPVVFIHGGAWRDVNNTGDDWRELIAMVAPLGVSAPTKAYALDYRLSPAVTHPHHLLDVIFALCHLKVKCGVDRVSLVGHSVGATLMLQLLSPGLLLERYKDELKGVAYECLPPGMDVLGFVRANLPEFRDMFFLDGIYNMVTLYEEYPAYRAFMGPAWRDDESGGTQLSLEREAKATGDAHSALVAATVPRSGTAIFERSFGRVVVIHSQQDTLLSPKQSVEFMQWLITKNVPLEFIIKPLGEHNDVYKNPEVALVISRVLR